MKIFHYKFIYCFILEQSLLSSGKISRDILQEIIHFIQSNSPFIGITSLMTCLLPFEICIDYLIEIQPEYLLNYAKSAILTDKKWQHLLISITMQCKQITESRSYSFYESLLKGNLIYIFPPKITKG